MPSDSKAKSGRKTTRKPQGATPAAASPAPHRRPARAAPTEEERTALAFPLAELTDPSGRDIRVVRIDIERTYRDFIECNPRTVGRFLRKLLPKKLREDYGDYRRIQLAETDDCGQRFRRNADRWCRELSQGSC